ncbi:MAG: acyl-CoA thioesterase [Azospirillum sp.]|nr:acyl-CoA thioesterase [Azospirillum sp.]
MADKTSADKTDTDHWPLCLTGGPALRTLAMPGDANPNGDIFGGWVLAQMDLAGGLTAVRRARGRVATVGVEAMTFHRPVNVGDEVSCYCRVDKVGRTSIRIRIELWVCRFLSGEALKVTEGVFTYVAISDRGRPREVPPLPEPARDEDIVECSSPPCFGGEL